MAYKSTLQNVNYSSSLKDNVVFKSFNVVSPGIKFATKENLELLFIRLSEYTVIYCLNLLKNITSILV